MLSNPSTGPEAVERSAVLVSTRRLDCALCSVLLIFTLRHAVGDNSAARLDVGHGPVLDDHCADGDGGVHVAG